MTRLLLLLNGLALVAGVALSYLVATRAPDLPQINADRIRFWSQPETYRGPEVAAAAKLAAPSPGKICLGLSDLDQQRFGELNDLLRSSGYADGQCRLLLGRKLGWWVFWPPEYEAAQREKAVVAMRAAGVEEFLRVREGSMAQSYSLGVFSLESQARQLRDSLRRKGLERVEYGPRPGTTMAQLECRAAAPERVARLQAALPAWAAVLDAAQCGAAVAE